MFRTVHKPAPCWRCPENSFQWAGLCMHLSSFIVWACSAAQRETPVSIRTLRTHYLNIIWSISATSEHVFLMKDGSGILCWYSIENYRGSWNHLTPHNFAKIGGKDVLAVMAMEWKASVAYLQFSSRGVRGAGEEPPQLQKLPPCEALGRRTAHMGKEERCNKDNLADVIDGTILVADRALAPGRAVHGGTRC